MQDRFPPSPGDYIRDELKRRGWTQQDLATVLDRPLTRVNEIIQGKQGVTVETAVALAAVLGETAETWLARESAYRLSLQRDSIDRVAESKIDLEGLRRRGRLYDMAPIKEMEKRGWIGATSSAVDLEAELKKFFGTDDLGSLPMIAAAMRRSGESGDPLSPSQRAWCFRVRQLGRNLLAAEYRESELPKCEAALRKIAAHPQETHKVPEVLASFGVRLVVVEPLAGSKVDGVAFWNDGSPIIGMSVRLDRVDNFWFTLCHELSHVRHRDEPHLDSDLSGGGEQMLEVKSPIELRADTESAETLIPKKEIESFILRVGPMYSKDRIIRFANRMKIHPGIIVGQLQNRGEIGWSANREMLSKIRQFVVPAATTDGWGRAIDPRNLS